MATLAKVYLVIYNVVLTIGWSVILALSIQHLVRKKNHIGLYDSIEQPLQIFQSAAILEVLHCAVGLVPSSVMLTAFQVASRLFVTWAIAHSVPQIHDSPGVMAFIFAWSITEVIRYSFYAFSLINSLPYFLQWCRYTFFYILYPIGVTGELVTMYSSLPYLSKSGMYSVRLPNAFNFGFDFYSLVIVLMFSYIPIFPQLYFHMIRQRKKIIGGKGKRQ
ncbi:Very-long-chain (3R)-3-hydroxyacyl-CoA dehydratase 2 [Acropora cervicornis]|uniref:Very-long-chain (3R)-3-hydroxyacyl-CoA dehydratase n=1 Tax=Acropora cervicornis TaxID=6130 RepID=A0AAD9QEN1_ACRCE|nr:Very-long-chain (3R)-3-hydroxyacyl-CoA dehydratase 2 [Acropora cervicornis]